jgi:hypothetical protein
MDLRGKELSRVVMTSLLMLILNTGLKADLKYQELTQITGGMLEGATKVMGFFGAKGLDNMLSTHYIKGDRMRTDNYSNNELTNTSIVRLDREEIVIIDHKKKSYTVMTFEQMRQQMEKAMEAMQNSGKDPAKDPKAPDVKLEPKVSIKDTGETKVINGFNARHVILSIQMEGQDQKSKDKGSFGVDSDLWLTKDISDFGEQREFYQKYALKFGSPQMSRSMMGSPVAQDPRIGPAMEEFRKQAEKMEGVAVLTVANVNVSGTPAQGTQSSQDASSAHPSGSSADSQESLSSEAMAKSLGKVLGGFGGFGHKKKKEEPKPTETAQSASPSDASSSSPGAVSVNLMKTTTELKSVSNAGLDSGLFEVPQGYKLIQK